MPCSWMMSSLGTSIQRLTRVHLCRASSEFNDSRMAYDDSIETQEKTYAMSVAMATDTYLMLA